jgi:hypothetical protein
MAKKQIHSIHIEPASNGHMVTVRYKRDESKKMSPHELYNDSSEEKSVHESCCGAAMKIHDVLSDHEGASDHDIEGMEGEANENLAKHGYKKGSVNDPKKHPGFKNVENKISKKEHVSSKAAAAILASSSRNASKSAHNSNPKLNKVK